MNGGKHGPVQGMGYALCAGEFTITAVKSTSPTVFTGSLARWVDSVTYAATGKYTIVFKEGFSFANTPRFLFSGMAPLANGFTILQLLAYNATTRTLVINACTNATTGLDLESGSLVTVFVFASDSQGK